MLNESLIEQFARDCPSTKILLSKAWPSLTLESKLQLIEAFADYQPSWLSLIAMSDEDEIVRIWALKNVCIIPEEADDEDIHKNVVEVFEGDDLALSKKIKADKSEIVNKFVKGRAFSHLLFTEFPKISQEARLIRLRHIETFETNLFLNNIEMITSSLSRSDLIECLDEIIGNMHNYRFTLDAKIENLNRAWNLIAGLDEKVALRLARILPISIYFINPMGSNTIKGEGVNAEIFLKLPRLALFWVLKTNKDRPSIELLKLTKTIINDNSDRFDDHVRNLAHEIYPEMEPDFEEVEPVSETSVLSKLKNLL